MYILSIQKVLVSIFKFYLLYTAKFGGGQDSLLPGRSK